MPAISQQALLGGICVIIGIFVMIYGLICLIRKPPALQAEEKDRQRSKLSKKKLAPEHSASTSSQPPATPIRLHNQGHLIETFFAQFPLYGDIDIHIAHLSHGLSQLEAASFRGHAARLKKQLQEIKDIYVLFLQEEQDGSTERTYTKVGITRKANTWWRKLGQLERDIAHKSGNTFTPLHDQVRAHNLYISEQQCATVLRPHPAPPQPKSTPVAPKPEPQPSIRYPEAKSQPNTPTPTPVPILIPTVPRRSKPQPPSTSAVEQRQGEQRVETPKERPAASFDRNAIRASLQRNLANARQELESAGLPPGEQAKSLAALKRFEAQLDAKLTAALDQEMTAEQQEQGVKALFDKITKIVEDPGA